MNICRLFYFLNFHIYYGVHYGVHHGVDHVINHGVNQGIDYVVSVDQSVLVKSWAISGFFSIIKNDFLHFLSR